MSDQHARDVLALVDELGQLEAKRGELRARIAWHLQLREMSAERELVAAPAPAREDGARAAKRRKAPAARQARGELQRKILAYLADTPDRGARQVALAVGVPYESTRQALHRMRAEGVVVRNLGGGYAIKESHAGSGLVRADA